MTFQQLLLLYQSVQNVISLEKDDVVKRELAFVSGDLDLSLSAINH